MAVAHWALLADDLASAMAVLAPGRYHSQPQGVLLYTALMQSPHWQLPAQRRSTRTWTETCASYAQIAARTSASRCRGTRGTATRQARGYTQEKHMASMRGRIPVWGRRLGRGRAHHISGTALGEARQSGRARVQPHGCYHAALLRPRRRHEGLHAPPSWSLYMRLPS